MPLILLVQAYSQMLLVLAQVQSTKMTRYDYCLKHIIKDTFNLSFLDESKHHNLLSRILKIIQLQNMRGNSKVYTFLFKKSRNLNSYFIKCRKQIQYMCAGANKKSIFHLAKNKKKSFFNCIFSKLLLMIFWQSYKSDISRNCLQFLVCVFQGIKHVSPLVLYGNALLMKWIPDCNMGDNSHYISLNRCKYTVTVLWFFRCPRI